MTAGQEVGRWHDGGGRDVPVWSPRSTLRVVAAESCVDESASALILRDDRRPHDVVDAGVNVGTAQNHLSHLFAVSGCHEWGR